MIALESLQVKIGTLQSQLEEKSPGYKSSLEDIRVILQRDPEMIHLLKTDGELSVIFAAMANYKQIEIPVTVAKAEKSKIIPKNLSLDSF
jgi:hypothetical protein